MLSTLASSHHHHQQQQHTTYRVVVDQVDELSNVSGEIDVTVKQLHAVITGLCQFCQYKVRVVAYSVDGDSCSSDEVIGRTLSDGKFCQVESQ